MAVLNDYIYAVGGFDGSAGLNTAEVEGGGELLMKKKSTRPDRCGKCG